MALVPQNGDAFFREVDEDLRRDRLVRFARQRGGMVAALVVVALVLLAAGLWWRHHREAQAGLAGEQFSAVLDAVPGGRVRPDDPRLAALAGSSRDGYSATARLTQAALAAVASPADGAKRYGAIAGDTALPAEVRDLALVRATALAFDTMPPATVVDRLKPLAVPGNAWFGSAGEMTALAWLKLNRRERAAPIFAAIARDASVPTSLRGRAAGMAAALGQTVGNIAAPGGLKE